MFKNTCKTVFCCSKILVFFNCRLFMNECAKMTLGCSVTLAPILLGGTSLAARLESTSAHSFSPSGGKLFPSRLHLWLSKFRSPQEACEKPADGAI